MIVLKFFPQLSQTTHRQYKRVYTIVKNYNHGEQHPWGCPQHTQQLDEGAGGDQGPGRPDGKDNEMVVGLHCKLEGKVDKGKIATMTVL